VATSAAASAAVGARWETCMGGGARSAWGRGTRTTRGKQR
jgi:hypothetical protein